MLVLAIFIWRSRFLAYAVELVLLLCFVVSFLHIYFYIYAKFSCDLILRWYCLIGRRLGITTGETRENLSWVEADEGRHFIVTCKVMILVVYWTIFICDLPISLLFFAVSDTFIFLLSSFVNPKTHVD
jgi:hypothetical protein